jgi:hypothetical protein
MIRAPGDRRVNADVAIRSAGLQSRYEAYLGQYMRMAAPTKKPAW